MNLDIFNFELCDLPEKQVIEGLCLSYDLLRGCCLETMRGCLAEPPGSEALNEAGPSPHGDA